MSNFCQAQKVQYHYGKIIFKLSIIPAYNYSAQWQFAKNYNPESIKTSHQNIAAIHCQPSAEYAV